MGVRKTNCVLEKRPTDEASHSRFLLIQHVLFDITVSFVNFLTSAQQSQGCEPLSGVCVADDGGKAEAHWHRGLGQTHVVIHQGQQTVKLQTGALQPELCLPSGLVTGLLDYEVVHHKAMVIAKLHWQGCALLPLAASSHNEVLK